MEKDKVGKYAFWIVFTEAAGALSAFLTKDGMKAYQEQAVKPALSPPGAAFPIAWGVLYLLMGVGMARISLTGDPEGRKICREIYLIQLGVNFLWSVIFFNMRLYGFALVWLAGLWLLVLVMILAFRRVDRTAGNLQIPYLLWLTFAAYLNGAVWLLNR